MPETRDELLGVLRQAMKMEYGALFVLPNYIAQVQDEELKREFRLIADVELEHAEKTAALILSLGGTPPLDLPQFTVRTGLRNILDAQIEAEKAAVEIYAKGAALTLDPEIKKVLSDIGREEEGHLALMQRSLARLEP